MRTQYYKFALTAAFGLALAFVFSCSSGSENDGGNPLPVVATPSYDDPSPYSYSTCYWIETTPATCYEKGVATLVCGDSLSTETQEIPLLAWEWAVTTPATCYEKGVFTGTCISDPSKTETQEIPQLYWGAWEEEVGWWTGVEARTCPDGTSETREIARCGEANYPIATQFCQSWEGTDIVWDLCGGNAYDVVTQRCCGSSIYSYETQFCQSTDVVKPLCGWATYTADEFCQSYGFVKPLCGGDTYYGNEFCQSPGVVKPLCGSATYTSTEFCQSPNVVKKLCGGDTYLATQGCCGSSKYTLATQFCQSPDVVSPLCGSATYTLTEFCQSPGVVKPLCGTATYAADEFCQSPNVVKPLCGGDAYNVVTQGCCGGSKYTLATQFCQNPGVVKPLCGSATYTSTEFCQSPNVVKSLCDNKTYAVEQSCQGNVVMDKCGGGWYNSVAQFCQSGTNAVKNLCGGDTYTSTQGCCGDSRYTLATEFCQGPGVVKPLCGSATYTADEFCQSLNVVKPLCGSATYTADEFCQSPNVVKPLCGNKTYAVEQSCQGNVVMDKCGSEWYDATAQFCQSPGVVKPLCGTVTYASTQYCSNGTLKNYGSVTYEGKTYKTVVIGDQTWMAENLNYNATNSRCYGDNSGGDSQGNCAKYGRLYNWATAMGINISFNISSYNPSSSTKYRGVCPSGWHIPNDNEWNTLMNSVGGSSIAGRKLKSTSGWSDCGLGSSYSYQCEDAYGFSALPGGRGSSGGNFYDVGNYGYWWSASEDDSRYVYGRGMNYYSEYVNYNYSVKSLLSSVRCLQD